MKYSPAYRLLARVLALSVTLGAALPALCHQGGEAMPAHSDGAGHPTAPCEAVCHAGEQPATLPSAAAVAPASERSPAGPTVWPVSAAGHVVSARAPHAGARGRPQVARAGPPPWPVRLHVSNAVFLN